MKRTKAFIAALSALCVTFSAMVSVSAADELQDTTGGQPEDAVVQNNELTMENAGACIGNTPYLNWRDAIISVAPGQTIKLLEDYNDVVQNVYDIRCMSVSGKEFTLDLNGYTINLGNACMRIWNDMKITDSSKDHTGSIIANHKAIGVGDGNIGYNVTLDGVTVISENNPVINNNSGKGTRYGTIIVENNANLTINNSNVTGGYEAIEIDGGTVEINENSTIEGKGVDAIYIHDPGAELTINGGTINGTGDFAIVGNGTNTTTDYRGGTTININGGNVIAENGTAIYLPQYGEVKIEGGSITGDETAIEIESGILNIKGGMLTATTDECGFLNPKDGDGTTTSGAAVAAVCRTLPDKNYEGGGGYYGNMDINISGGTFNGVCGVAKFIYQNCDENSSMKNMSITGGTFSGKDGKDINGGDVKASAVYMADDCNNKSIISGGTFNTDVTSYLADGTAYSSDNGEYTVYSAANKITGAGTYKTALNEDNKYDQLTMESKEISTPTQVSDIGFNVTIGNNDTKTYNYTNQTTVAEGTVLFGLIVTDIPDGETVTVNLQ